MLSRTSTTYVSTHGVDATFAGVLANKLKECWFSVNLDEATNNAMDKILNMMVKFYDDDKKSTVVAHFASVIVNIATAQNLHQAVVCAFQSEDIPLVNMISCLRDNCATMRGSRSGLETSLRKDNKHLLDIAGDTVHPMTNADKALFKPFDGYVENICSGMFYDIEKSPKSKRIDRRNPDPDQSSDFEQECERNTSSC